MKKFIIYMILLFIIICSLFLLYILEYDAKQCDTNLKSEIYEEFKEIENLEETDSSNSNPIIYRTNSRGNIYRVIATISIPKLNIHYPIINETTYEYLKISPTKLAGNNPNESGNFCIVGHNFEDDTFFSNLDLLENGDIIKLKDTSGNYQKYSVYNIYTVRRKDTSCLNQDTNGKTELTLITCTNKQDLMLIVKCIALKNA